MSGIPEAGFGPRLLTAPPAEPSMTLYSHNPYKCCGKKPQKKLGLNPSPSLEGRRFLEAK